MKKNNEAKAANPNERKVDDKSLKAPNNTPDKPNPNYQDKIPNLNNLTAILMPKDSEFKNGTTDRKRLPNFKLKPKKSSRPSF